MQGINSKNIKKQLLSRPRLLLEFNMGLITDMQEIYYRFNEEYADPRTNKWFLMSSPFPVLAIVGLYLWFCLKAGPHFMKNKEAFTLRSTMKYYNLFQILYSAFLVYQCSKLWINQYSFRCEPIDYSYNPIAMTAAYGTYFYFFAKITELLDTILFVLRKKHRQVTTLHLYHHTSMVIVMWIIVKYYAGGLGTFIGYVNSMVHVVMYSYYFISALGPQYQKYLWWKRHITKLQLLQFICCFVMALQALLRDCAYPKSLCILFLYQSILFFYMFGNFYLETYRKKGRTKVVEDGFTPTTVDGNQNIIKNGKHL